MGFGRPVATRREDFLTSAAQIWNDAFKVEEYSCRILSSHRSWPGRNHKYVPPPMFIVIWPKWPINYSRRKMTGSKVIGHLSRPLMVPGPQTGPTGTDQPSWELQRSGVHSGGLLVGVCCCWVVVTWVFICHMAFILGVTTACTHSLLSNTAAVFTFYHCAYIWTRLVFLKTASEPSVCASVLSVGQAETRLSLGFLRTRARPFISPDMIWFGDKEANLIELP